MTPAYCFSIDALQHGQNVHAASGLVHNLSAAAPSPAPVSFLILFVLLLILAASSAMYWLLVRRATSHRRWVALSDWAQDEGFRFTRRADATPPAPFDSLPHDRQPLVRLQLARRDNTLLLQLQRGSLHDPIPTTAESPWNLLIRPLPQSWTPTGLRPAPDGASESFIAARSTRLTGDASMQSLVELFDLPSHPLMRGAGRLLVHGGDSAPARKLAASVVAALLPPDMGLLLHGNALILDFSRRPFDVLEFGRVLALAEQVAARLPGS